MTSQALASLKDRHLFIANQLEQARPRLQAIIPLSSSITPSRVIAVTLDALVRDPHLLKCEPRSIVRSVIHAAEIGLELGSPNGEAFIVPFKGRATMMPGYRGFVKLIRQTPRVNIVKSVLVREADEFDVDEGANKLHHVLGKGALANRGKVTHVYSRVYYVDGSSQYEVMHSEEVQKIKADVLARSNGRPSPWRTHEDEMMKKCPLRRQAKWLDLTGGPLMRDGSVSVAKRALELDTIESMRREELGSLREGLEGTRAQELKDMLEAQDKAVDAIPDAEIFDEDAT